MNKLNNTIQHSTFKGLRKLLDHIGFNGLNVIEEFTLQKG